MSTHRRTITPLLTPIAVLALATTAPLLMAGEAAEYVTRSVVVGSAHQDRTETIVRCIGQIVRKLIAPTTPPCLVAASSDDLDLPEVRDTQRPFTDAIRVETIPHPLLIDTPPPAV